jgi:hypothetical protein
MNRNHITAAQSRQLYVEAFKPHTDIIIKAEPAKSGFLLTVTNNKIEIDRVLVRWDRCIFRNFEMVYDGREK